MRWPDIGTPDGRRAWAFAAIVGGAMVFSLFIWVALWVLRNHEGFVFYLAIAAHVQVFVGMTALGFAMGRRLQASISRDGVEISDKEHHE